MKKKSAKPKVEEFECPGCHFFCLKSKAMNYHNEHGNIVICPTCYRHRTAPTTEDILRAVMFAQFMSNRRHEMLWAKQIKENKRNTSNIGTPATASMKLVGENIEATISALLLHNKIAPDKKKK